MNTVATNRNERRFKGFGLVELMVALTISLLIMAGVSTIFVNTKRAYNVQDQLSRLQENARFAMHYLMRDLRMAGYLGCFGEVETVNSTLNGGSGFLYNASIPLEGLDGDSGATTWSPSGSTELPADVEPDTDVLAIRMVDPSSAVQLSSPMPNTSAELKVTDTSGFDPDDIVVLSDCSSGDLMQITAVQDSAGHVQHGPGGDNPGNETQKLDKAYDTNATVFKYATRRYFIRQNAAGVKSLWRDDNGLDPQELVEGIEDLQLTYGVDTDNDGSPNRYYRAGEAGLQSSGEWANVISVRVGVLARSLNSKDAGEEAAEIKVNGKSVGPFNDGRQRRVFQTTVLLRNVTGI